jgi:hypothetical protein
VYNAQNAARNIETRSIDRMDIIERFKRVWQPTCYERELPSKLQIRRGFATLKRDDERASFDVASGCRFRRETHAVVAFFLARCRR